MEWRPETCAEGYEQFVTPLGIKGTLQPPKTASMNEADEVIISERAELICAFTDRGHFFKPDRARDASVVGQFDSYSDILTVSGSALASTDRRRFVAVVAGCHPRRDRKSPIAALAASA